MKRCLILLMGLTLLTACKKDKEETPETVTTEDTIATPLTLSFGNKMYREKSKLPGKEPVTYVSIDVPEAVGEGPAADSINNKLFHVVRSIVYFGEKPTNAKSYKELMDSFIGSYDSFKKQYPDEDLPWEAKIKGTIDYQNDSIINIKLNNYMFTGGAHGYEGNRSLLFDAKTGQSLTRKDIFKDEKGFTALAEKKFREKFKIPAGKNINATGLFFPNDKFILPEAIFFTEDGLLLYYNAVEVGSFADGTKELLIPYSEATPYLK